MPPRRLTAAQALARIFENCDDNEALDEEIFLHSEDEEVDILPPHPEDDTSVEEETGTDDEDVMTDKDGRKWKKNPPQNRGRRGMENIFRERVGPKDIAHKNTILETWQLYFPDSLLMKILHYSQLKADNLGLNETLSLPELKAFIAILYFRGLHKDNKIPVSELWQSANQYSTIFVAGFRPCCRIASAVM